MSFDLTVDHRDPKNGRVVKHTPYVRFSNHVGTVYLRDGVFYTESGLVAPDSLIEGVAGLDVLLAHKKPEATTTKK